MKLLSERSMGMNKLLTIFMTLAFAAGLAGCSPEVGSAAWCKAMDAMPKGDWTANEAADYAKHCIFK